MTYLTNNQRSTVHGIFKDDNWDDLKKFFQKKFKSFREFIKLIFA